MKSLVIISLFTVFSNSAMAYGLKCNFGVFGAQQWTLDPIDSIKTITLMPDDTVAEVTTPELQITTACRTKTSTECFQTLSTKADLEGNLEEIRKKNPKVTGFTVSTKDRVGSVRLTLTKESEDKIDLNIELTDAKGPHSYPFSGIGQFKHQTPIDSGSGLNNYFLRFHCRIYHQSELQGLPSPWWENIL